jgi:HAD superfamily hydrolase (TIGR01509 family)
MRAILWDLDDTLLATLPARKRALAHAYERCLGTCVEPLALWRSHRGGTLEDLGRRLMGTDFALFTREYRDFYYANDRRCQPYEGIESVLGRFLGAGLPMAVVTSKIAWGATDELATSGLLRFFQAVVGFDDCDLHKPDPEPLQVAMERLLIDDPGEVAFVGDSPADVFAARNAGCRSIAALWGTHDAELLLDACPDAVARWPREIPEVISVGSQP